MSARMNRRCFLRQAAGLGMAIPLFAACAPGAASSPTAAPTKPAEASKPAEAVKPAAPAALAASPAAVAPTVPASVTKVTYGMASINPYHIVAITSTEKPELMRKHGIEIEMVLTQNSPNAVQAVVGGSINVASVTPDASWPAQDKTPDLMQIMGSANGTPYTLIVNTDIKKVDELKGKSVGASALKGGADTTALRILLLENGLRDADYQLLQVGSVAERTAAMKAGTISGVVQLEPQTTQLKDAGFIELDNADNYPALKNVQTLIILSKKGWYGSGEAPLNFVRGWVDVTTWLYDPKNKDELLAIMTKTMKVDMKPAENAYDRHIVKSRTPPQDPRVDLSMAQQMAENQKKTGVENVPTDLARYIDNSLVEKALKS